MQKAEINLFSFRSLVPPALGFFFVSVCFGNNSVCLSIFSLNSTHPLIRVIWCIGGCFCYWKVCFSFNSEWNVIICDFPPHRNSINTRPPPRSLSASHTLSFVLDFKIVYSEKGFFGWNKYVVVGTACVFSSFEMESKFDFNNVIKVTFSFPFKLKKPTQNNRIHKYKIHKYTQTEIAKYCALPSAWKTFALDYIFKNSWWNWIEKSKTKTKNQLPPLTPMLPLCRHEHSSNKIVPINSPYSFWIADYWLTNIEHAVPSLFLKLVRSIFLLMIYAMPR